VRADFVDITINVDRGLPSQNRRQSSAECPDMDVGEKHAPSEVAVIERIPSVARRAGRLLAPSPRTMCLVPPPASKPPSGSILSFALTRRTRASSVPT